MRSRASNAWQMPLLLYSYQLASLSEVEPGLLDWLSVPKQQFELRRFWQCSTDCVPRRATNPGQCISCDTIRPTNQCSMPMSQLLCFGRIVGFFCTGSRHLLAEGILYPCRKVHVNQEFPHPGFMGNTLNESLPPPLDNDSDCNSSVTASSCTCFESTPASTSYIRMGLLILHSRSRDLWSP